MEKKQTQIRLPADLYDEIKDLAQKHNRSLNGQLIEFIQKGMKPTETEYKTNISQAEIKQ